MTMRIPNLILAASLCVLLANQVHGTDIRYRSSGDYFASTNTTPSTGWQTANGLPPSAADNARFNWSSNTVTLAATAPTITAFQMGVDESGGLVVNNGGVLTATGNSTVGNNNNNLTGFLTINGGGTVTNLGTLKLGASAPAAGTTLTGLITINGGKLTIGSHLWVAAVTNSIGKIFITNGGIINVGGNIGLGTVNATAPSGGTGSVYVQNGGTLNLNQISANNSIQPGSVLDISGSGQVIINGNSTNTITTYTNAAKITAYGGLGTVGIDYNNTNAGKTTLTATLGSSSPLTNGNGFLNIRLSNINVVVSWPTSAVYYVLNSATNLSPAPVVWLAVTNPAITSNGVIQVTLNRAGPTRFFKLVAEVDPSTMIGKLLMGYQGWHASPGDGSANNKWVHWFGSNTPDAANAQFDFWPDTSELDADELFATSLTYSNGSTAKLYSAYKQKTVVRHFKWMQENHLDGVFFQRFLSDLPGGNLSALRNQVATNVRVGAETYGRVFAIMYDVSGYATNALFSKLTNDWTYLINTQRVTNSSAYLYHKGKPVVAIWGFGFSDGNHLSSPQLAQQTIDWFKAAGCTVMGGVPKGWRTLSGDSYSDPAWSAVYRSFDVISPWTVGRYSSNSGADTYRTSYIVPDLADCTSHGIDYLPVIFPGFSWTNLNSGPFNQIPRNGGNFYWRQAYNAVLSGCTMIYGAMFDEVDEGTAMYKLAPTAAQLPAQGTFVPLNIDGYNLNSDWYLRLADQAGKMLRGEIPQTTTIPITPP